METAATRLLRARGIAYTEHFYEYVEHGGAERGASELGVPAAEVVKTLLMQDEEAQPLIVLMHGDRKVSTKSLARQAERKRIEPCKPAIAERHSGYRVGGTSPFGTKKPLPVFMERSILELPAVYINGGKRGFLIRVSTPDLVRVLEPKLVEVAAADKPRRRTIETPTMRVLGMIPSIAALTLTHGAPQSRSSKPAMRPAHVSTSLKCPLAASSRMRSATCS